MTTTRTNHGSEIPLPVPPSLIEQFLAAKRQNERTYRQFMEGSWDVEDPLESLNPGRRFFQQLDDLYCK